MTGATFFLPPPARSGRVSASHMHPTSVPLSVHFITRVRAPCLRLYTFRSLPSPLPLQSSFPFVRPIAVLACRHRTTFFGRYRAPIRASPLSRSPVNSADRVVRAKPRELAISNNARQTIDDHQVRIHPPVNRVFNKPSVTPRRQPDSRDFTSRRPTVFDADEADESITNRSPPLEPDATSLSEEGSREATQYNHAEPHDDSAVHHARHSNRRSTVKKRFRRKFELCADHPPAGDQPKAISFLIDGLCKERRRFQTLHGVTGSGKTFMMANVIANVNRPTLVLAPNKTLAAQLCNEFSRYFPRNRVEFFVSHFKFYQPEAYLPNSDKYIAKSSAVDHEIDRLRHAATKSLFERNDTIVVASVSSIYGLGLPSEYLERALEVQVGDFVDIARVCEDLTSLNYIEDAEKVLTERGHFSRSSSSILVSPPWERDGVVYKYSMDDHVVRKMEAIDTLTNEVSDLGPDLSLYPAKHFVTPKHRLNTAIAKIEEETHRCVEEFERAGKLLEAARLRERVDTDIEMMRKVGFCQGAENYSLYLSGREVEDPPETLLDYMPRDGEWLLFIDESHVTVPQLSAMHAGNAARKRKLIRHGFRLPSSIENRPLSGTEFWRKIHQAIFVSATPGPFEADKSRSDGIVEAVIRPTAVVDPIVDIVRTKGQLEHLTIELAQVAARGGKAIVTTITKRFAEDVADCLSRKPAVSGVLDRTLNVSFLHSGIDSVGRMEVLEAMRGENLAGSDSMERERSLDVVVGVNLLREGIDLPAVQLVAILDADSEGFLRGETALVQTIGRAARNINGRVIMYADSITGAMQRAIDETSRRRRLQIAHNSVYDTKPISIGDLDSHSLQRSEDSLLNRIREQKLQGGERLEKRRFRSSPKSSHISSNLEEELSTGRIPEPLVALRQRMLEAADSKDFESAAILRDQLLKLGGDL